MRVLALVIAVAMLPGCMVAPQQHVQQVVSGSTCDAPSLAAGQASVYGIVTNERGEPVLGAKAVVWRSSGEVAKDFTDQHGCYVLVFPPAGKTQLEFTAKCYTGNDDVWVSPGDRAAERHDETLESQPNCA